MAKDSTFQVRMDSQVKAQVEELYRSLGTSFAEAIRMFARQSLSVGGLPFQPTLKTWEELSEEEIDQMIVSAFEDVRAGNVLTEEQLDAYMEQDFPLD